MKKPVPYEKAAKWPVNGVGEGSCQESWEALVFWSTRWGEQKGKVEKLSWWSGMGEGDFHVGAWWAPHHTSDWSRGPGSPTLPWRLTDGHLVRGRRAPTPLIGWGAPEVSPFPWDWQIAICQSLRRSRTSGAPQPIRHMGWGCPPSVLWKWLPALYSDCEIRDQPPWIR